jgi:hypothetical protein
LSSIMLKIRRRNANDTRRKVDTIASKRTLLEIHWNALISLYNVSQTRNTETRFVELDMHLPYNLPYWMTPGVRHMALDVYYYYCHWHKSMT